jgi:cephalosporin hydroxylase
MRLRPLSPARYGRKLRRELARTDPTVRIARGSLRRGAVQNESELTRLLRLLRRVEPIDCVVEIGTHHGGTLYAWCRAASPTALVVSIDLPGGDFGGGYGKDAVATMQSYARPGQQLHFLREDSHEPQTMETLRAILAGRAVDFLMIDGDHSAAGVAADFEMYGPLVRPGGVIAFHDIVPGRPEAVGGVPGYWQELKSGNEHIELVDDWGQGGLGIGVVRVS